jgi:glycosyltransferase involved in cell wall biosynthesis
MSDDFKGNPFLSIVIPARNEERCLSHTLNETIRFLDQQTFEAEIIVVVNDSADQTLAIAESFSLRYPHIKVLHEELPGKGRAVRRGMLAARGACRFFADADLSMPIAELQRFLPPIMDAPIVIASREAPGAVRYGEPYIRHLAGRVFNLLIRRLVLPGIQDTQCGFKMFRADAAENLFSRQTLTGWSFDVELLCIARLLGYPICEVPVPWYYNPKSKISLLKEAWCMVFDLFKIRLNVHRGVYR